MAIDIIVKRYDFAKLNLSFFEFLKHSKTKIKITIIKANQLLIKALMGNSAIFEDTSPEPKVKK